VEDKDVALTPNSSITVQIGAAGTGGSSPTAGGDTILNSSAATCGFVSSLRLPDGERTEEIVAIKIVEVVKEGLRDPGEIYERVLSDLASSDWPARAGSDSAHGRRQDTK
jgi:hypothetical protein